MFTRFKVAMVLCLALLLGLSGRQASAQTTTTITVFHFSDYHSHAVPFYSEGANNQAGIARTIGFLKTQKQANPNTLVFNGGDMFNKGSPTWSDEYKCAEWPWFNGLWMPWPWATTTLITARSPSRPARRRSITPY